MHAPALPTPTFLGVLLLLLASCVAPLRADRLEDERLEQTGTAITVIFDDSGSMSGPKIEQARTAFRNWLERVPAQHRLSLIALNAGQLVPFGRGNNAEMLAAVGRLRAAGGTPLVATIETALAEIEKRRAAVGPYERQIVIVFTDGQESSRAGNAGVQRLLRRARELNVETVGIGFAGDGDYMARDATRYSNAGDGAQLQAALAKVDVEIGDTSDIRISPEVLSLMSAGPPPAPTLRPPPAGVTPAKPDAFGAGAPLAKPAASPATPAQPAPTAAPAAPPPTGRVPLFAVAVAVVFVVLVWRTFGKLSRRK